MLNLFDEIPPVGSERDATMGIELDIESSENQQENKYKHIEILRKSTPLEKTSLESMPLETVSAKSTPLEKTSLENTPSETVASKSITSSKNTLENVSTQPTMQQTSKQQNISYEVDDILAAATEYFEGDTLAASVWMNKYALKDSAGNIYERTPDDMHRRIARELARIETKYAELARAENKPSAPVSEQEAFDLMQHFKYIVPQGSPMAGIGNKYQIASLSNCFVIGNGDKTDSYGGIMKVDEEQVQLMKRRGGVGHDLSHIRPNGSPVKNSALTSTGIVPFMERYSNSTREVAQDGRRGALMLSISIKHPDSEKFIDAKLTDGKVTGANVSVKITDEFMQAVVDGKPFIQEYPIGSKNPLYSQEVDADKIWKKIVHNAWKSAEPGVLFWDTILRESVPDCYAEMGFRTVSTNPCGEIPLCPYDSCRLLAMNLYSYVQNPFMPDAKFDFDLFKQHARIAQRFMDDIIDLELEGIDRIIEKVDSDPEGADIKRTEKELWLKIKMRSMEGRRTGLGITAEGDMLAALGLRYGSPEATDFSVNVHRTLAVAAYTSSVEMARERGAFPVFDAAKEVRNPFISRLRKASPELYDDMVLYGRRNIALLTVAPTGSVSICTQTTSGIEPVFLVSYRRRRKVNPNDKNVTVAFVDETGDSFEEYNVLHPKFMEWLRANGYDLEEVKSYDDKQIGALVKQSPYYKATSYDIDWVSKVEMQGRVQKWVDHSISVTVNIPENTPKEVVNKIYLTAWNSGCKGMTVYRENSRSGVLTQKEDKKQVAATSGVLLKRPARLDANIVRFQNAYEKWVAFVGLHNGRPYEIFTGKADDISLPSYVDKGEIVAVREADKPTRYDFVFKDRDGYEITWPALSRTFDETYWNYAKLISGILSQGIMPIDSTIRLITGLKLGSDEINTWKNGVVRALKRYIPDGTVAEGVVCPECGDKGLVFKEGCLLCPSCGYSKCG